MGHLCVRPQLQSIASRPHLLTVHDFEQEGSAELDTVILKALVKGEGGSQPARRGPGAPGAGRGCVDGPVRGHGGWVGFLLQMSSCLGADAGSQSCAPRQASCQAPALAPGTGNGAPLSRFSEGGAG